MTILIGIDEAGRGPVIGPMVMCAFAIEAEKEQNLRNLGVKDSKMVPPAKRNQLFDNLSENFQYTMKVVTAKEVDDALNDPELNLNWLEAVTSANLCNELIKDLGTDKVKIILDCPSVNTKAYKEYFKRKLGKDIEIISEHKADVNYPCVSAASIIAKVTRDRAIYHLKKEYNVDFGSGYPSDPKTKAFLEQNFDKYDFFRKTWASWKKIAKKSAQKGLGEY
jgi:ribonuclease HII